MCEVGADEVESPVVAKLLLGLELEFARRLRLLANLAHEVLILLRTRLDQLASLRNVVAHGLRQATRTLGEEEILRAVETDKRVQRLQRCVCVATEEVLQLARVGRCVSALDQ